MFACCKSPRVEDDEALQLQQQQRDSGVPAKGANGVAENWGGRVQPAQPSSQASEEEEALDARRKSSKEATSSSRQSGFGRLLPPIGSIRGPRKKKVAPEPSLQRDSDVLMSDQSAAAAAAAAGSAGASSSRQSGQESSFQQQQTRPPGFVSPTDSFPQTSMLSRTASRANSTTGVHNRDMTAEELKSLGFTLHTSKTTEKSKLKSQPLAVMALEAIEDAVLPRGRPRNNLVPLHVNTACRVYFGIGGHGEYGQVMSKLLRRDTLLTFAIQKALRNLKRGNPAAVSHVTPDPAGQTSSLLGMRITPCVWKTQDKPSHRGKSSRITEDEVLLPALAIEHNVPYDPAEVVPRLMRDYAVLSHVPAILTLIDFQGKVLYQNASSLTYMGDLLRVKYDHQLSDGLLRVLFMYDLQNLDQMLEDVLAGEEWRGVIQVPGSLRRYLAASEGASGANGSTSLDPGGRPRISSTGVDRGASLDGGREPRPSGFGVAGAGSDLDVEFQIVDKSNHPAFVSSSAQGHEQRPRRPYMLAPTPILPAPPPGSIGSSSTLQQQQQQDAAFLDYPPPHHNLHAHGSSSAINHLPQRGDVWDHAGGAGRASLSEGGSGEHVHAYLHGAPGEYSHPHHQQQFQQRKFMTLLERQGHGPMLAHSRTNSRPHAGASSGAFSGHFDPSLANYAGADLLHVGARPPSNTSLATASHADLHPNSSSTSGHHPTLPYVDSLPHSGFHSNLPTSGGPIPPPPLHHQQQQLQQLQRAGSEALTAVGSDGGGGGGGGGVLGTGACEALLPQGPGAQLLLEPVEEDEGAYDEMQACFHEVHAMSLLDPVLDKQVIMLVQTDVTARVELENKLADLTDAQLSMLEQLFPRHIIEYMLARVPNKGDRNLRDLANMHEQVMVLFCDVVGFTSMSKEVEPSEVMHFLNELYESFDKLVDEYDMYKLDIVGDCYIVVAGLIKEDQDGFVCVDEMDDGEVTSNAVRIMQFAKAMLRESRPVLMPHNHEPVQLRIGIHTGPLVSGLVGAKMPKFTLFGDTMNTASRMETCCKPGCVHVSDAFAQLLPHEEWGSTGGVQVKGKGMMQTYLWEPNADTQQDLSSLDAAMAVSALQQRTNHSSNGSLRSHHTSRTTRSRYTPFSRRQSAAGDLDDSGDEDGPTANSNHPLLTILTNIRKDGSGGNDEDEGLGFGVEGGTKSFVSLHGRSSNMRLAHRRRSSNSCSPNDQTAIIKPATSGTSTSNGGSGHTSKRPSDGYTGLQKPSSSQVEDAHHLAAATAALTGRTLSKTTSTSLHPSFSAAAAGPGGTNSNSRNASGERKSGEGSYRGGAALWEGGRDLASRQSSRSKQLRRSLSQRILGRQSSPNKRGSHEGQNVLLVAAAAAAAATNTASGNNRTSPFGPSAASAASRRSSEGGCGERRTPIMLDRASRFSEAGSSGHSLARSKSHLAPLASSASSARVGDESSQGGGGSAGANGGSCGGSGNKVRSGGANSRTQSGQLPVNQLRGVLKTNSISSGGWSKEVPPTLQVGGPSGGIGSEGSSPTAMSRSLMRGQNTSSVRFQEANEVWERPSQQRQSQLQQQQQQQQECELQQQQQQQECESQQQQQHHELGHQQEEQQQQHVPHRTSPPHQQHLPHQPSPLQQQQSPHQPPPHPHPPDPHPPDALPSPQPQQPPQQQHSPPQQAAPLHERGKGREEGDRAPAAAASEPRDDREEGDDGKGSGGGADEDEVLELEGGVLVPRPPPAPPPTLPVQLHGHVGWQSAQTPSAAADEENEKLVL